MSSTLPAYSPGGLADKLQLLIKRGDDAATLFFAGPLDTTAI
jgi:hypothetical protein